MISNKLKLMIITPFGTPFNDCVDSVLVKTENGELSLCKNYASTIGVVKKSKIKIKYNNQTLEYLISDGIYSIADNVLKIMINYFYENTEENLNIVNEKYKEINSNQIDEDSNNEISLVKLIQQLKRK